MAWEQQKPWILQDGPKDLILKNANVIDVLGGTTLSRRTVHLSEGKISSITTDKDEKPSDTSKTKHVDLKGAYLCPGLIDCHVHLTAAPGQSSVRELFSLDPTSSAYRTAWNAKQMLLRGFTTVRDTAGADYALREAIAEGLLPGPRLFICGKALSQTGGHGDLRPRHEDGPVCSCAHTPGIARLCDGVPACLEAARDELRKGADFLKIMVGGGVASPHDPLEMLQFTADEIKAITTTAKYLGKYVTAHAYSIDAIRHAIDNGVTSIEHGNFIDETTAKICAREGVFVTPTMVVYDALANPPYDKFLPASGLAKCRQVLASGSEALKTLYENGATVCYGTDLLANMHSMQNKEFGIRKEVLPDLEVLRHATVNAAKLLRMEGEVGVVKEGAFADLLVLQKNPLEDVTVLGDMENACVGIVKEGRVVMGKLDGLERDALYS